MDSTPGPHNTVPAPEEGEERCDFCSGRPVVASFPARNHTSEAKLPGIVLVNGSLGDWAACATCRDLIARGDREALAERSADSVPLPDDVKRVLGAQMKVEIRKIHDAFWANREGGVMAPEEARRS